MPVRGLQIALKRRFSTFQQLIKCEKLLKTQETCIFSETVPLDKVKYAKITKKSQVLLKQ